MEAEAAAAVTTTHIALVSIPAFSHQVSILEFAKRLVHLQGHHHFHVTCIIPTLGSNNNNTSSKPFFDSLPPTIHCIFLPSINFDDLEQHSVSLETQLSLAVSRSMPYVRESLKTLVKSNNNNLVALVADAVAHEALQFGKEFNVLSYIYFACSAMLLSLCLHSPRLHETVPCEYRDHPEQIEIPGCISVHGSDLPNSVQDRSSLAYKLFLERCKGYLLADGILVNSFMGMEEGAIGALSYQQEEGTGKFPPVYAIGPIIQTTEASLHKTLTSVVHEIHVLRGKNPVESAIGPIEQVNGPIHNALACRGKKLNVSAVGPIVKTNNVVDQTLTSPYQSNDMVDGRGLARSTSQKNIGWESLLWLDNQPRNSVLYVSFGSGGTLSQDQINELALGLELSDHRFLWVNVRAPNDRASAAYLSDDNVDPLDFLPKGFLERTKGRGLVMPCWAPQIEVLGHDSIGGFLTHCGWNSVLESVVKGVPMIAWPLFAEQRTNAAMVTDGLKVAVRVKSGADNGIVAKEEIAKLIKGIMEGLEGEEIRKRMIELKYVAACAIMKDGSSTKTLLKLALKWESLGKSM